MGSKIIGAIEIGTSKITVLVGELVSQRGLNIIGIGTTSSHGVMKGEIVDFNSAKGSVHAAILAAEKNAGATIDGVYLSQTGSHLGGFFNNATVSVGSPDNHVSEEDIQRVMESAKSRRLPEDRVFIHHLRAPFKVDGKMTKTPLGLYGRSLEVGYWSVHGQGVSIKNQINIVNTFGLQVDDLILSSLASARMVTEPNEREAGVLVLDIGRGTTDYALYQNGSVIRTGVVPVGGDHLTNDLSIGLRMSVKHAENLKVNSGTVDAKHCPKDQNVMLVGDLSIGDRLIPRRSLAMILELRMEEIFQVIQQQLQGFLEPGSLPAGVVLTGGTARIEGIDTLGERVFELPCRLGKNPQWVREELRAPEYSTVLGLLHFGLDNQRTIPAQQSGSKKGLLRSIFGRK